MGVTRDTGATLGLPIKLGAATHTYSVVYIAIDANGIGNLMGGDLRE